MKLISASCTTAVLLGIAALLHPTASYAASNTCPTACPTYQYWCTRGEAIDCDLYFDWCTHCTGLSAGSPAPLPVKHHITTNTAWVNSRQAALAK
jgi:hypothetical protein